MTLILIALTFGSGATDVAAFSRLGGVFTSVMTGNIVFWGLAAAERSVSLASHSAVSIAGYVTGVAGGTWVVHGFKIRGSGKPAEADRDSVLPAHVSWALFTELVLLAGLAAGWEATGDRPAGWAQFVLLAVTAAAMGVQSTSVNELGLSNVSTTFLTGTLTGLVSSLARPGQDTPHGTRRFGVLIGLAAGAGLCGLLLATVPRAVPALPLAALITALVLSAVPLNNETPSNGEDENPRR
ncbi:MAG: YoaK family protein [Streptosporangiaceae bacterium]